jgi:hypothetical protein
MRRASTHPALASRAADHQFLIDRGLIYSPTIRRLPASAFDEMVALESKLSEVLNSKTDANVVIRVRHLNEG